MTTYTTISNALVAVGARPFATTIQALRDNPLAIQEGDPTAPKIADAALSTTVTTAGQNWVTARLTTASVNSFIAGSSVGAIGTYAFLRTSSATGPGVTRAGSLLQYSSATSNVGANPAGTWLCMGNVGIDTATLWLRIS